MSSLYKEIMKYVLDTITNKTNGEIKQILSFIVNEEPCLDNLQIKYSELSTMIIRTQDEEVRNALIKLGWTPPIKKEN